MAAVPPFVFNPEMVDARDENVENMCRILCDTNSVLTNAILSNAVNQLVRHPSLTNDEYNDMNLPLSRTIVYYTQVLDIANFPNLQDELRNIGYRLLALPSLNRQHAVVGNRDMVNTDDHDDPVRMNDNIVEPPNGPVPVLPLLHPHFDISAIRLDRFLIERVRVPLPNGFYQRLFDYDPINRDIVPIPLYRLQPYEYLVYSNGDRVPVHPVVTDLRIMLNDLEIGLYEDHDFVCEIHDLVSALPNEDYNPNVHIPPERVIIYDSRVFNIERFPSDFTNICDNIRRSGYEILSLPSLQPR